MDRADVEAVLDLQEPASVLALASVFSQDAYPFPRAAVADRWRDEIADPTVECVAMVEGDRVVGFAATCGDELLHFGVALERWGSGLAGQALERLIARWRSTGVHRAWLRVFEENVRARRFYEREGWVQTAERSRSTFAPYPLLVHYERDLGTGG